MSSFLSERARAMVARSPMAPYVLEHFQHLDDSYGPERPDGYIGLCVAENRLLWPALESRLSSVRDVPHRVLGYDAMIGSAPFRAQIAAFMGRRIFKRAVAPEHVAAVAGAGSALELAFYALGNPGDAVLVPTPSYAGFWPDLETRDALTLVPVPTTHAEGFRLTPAHLDRAMASATRPVRALLFTTPDNPLGRVHTPAETEAILAWAETAGIHVVLDEVYALSIFGGASFTSVGALRRSLGDRIHVVWAFSKDFGASGLRCGVLVTENESVMRVVSTLAYWSACSGHTQHLLGEVLADEAWVDDYIQKLQGTLGDVYRTVTDRLSANNIPFLPAQGGIFVLCDLRSRLPTPTAEGEVALWRRMVDDAKVNLTPGSACRIAEPGFFRLCWAGVPLPHVLTGIDRLGRLFSSSGAAAVRPVL